MSCPALVNYLQYASTAKEHQSSHTELERQSTKLTANRLGLESTLPQRKRRAEQA